MNIRNILLSFTGLIVLTWAWDALILHPVSGEIIWVVRQHALYLSGLLAFGFMSFMMFLATRPVWLEKSVGGMDKIFALHKWGGILAIVFALAHWLLKLGSGPIQSLIGKVGKSVKPPPLAWMLEYKSIAKDMGEWAIYALLIMLAITLYKRIPYRQWRLLHKIMPVIYLVLVFHTLGLMPAVYWAGPSGWVTLVLLVIGTASAVIALTQRIGATHQHAGHILEMSQPADNVLELVCDPGPQWPGHTPGQFAFLRFDTHEGAHPFTISGTRQIQTSEHETQTQLVFEIKALGDYTKGLRQRLQIGQAVRIEGPYGQLDYRHGREDAQQIWVAAGIGITPFLAWLESLATNHSLQENKPITLHYSVRNAQTDPFVKLVQSLCDSLPFVTLNIHDASQQQRLTIQDLIAPEAALNDPHDIWFCGPNQFAQKLRQDLRARGLRQTQFHQEMFEMR